jgi:hypothetical protein
LFCGIDPLAAAVDVVVVLALEAAVDVVALPELLPPPPQPATSIATTPASIHAGSAMRGFVIFIAIVFLFRLGCCIDATRHPYLPQFLTQR